jgi:ABC-type multidrug transport system permease subunit
MADVKVIRDPERRTLAMSLLGVAIVVLAYFSLTAPWYAMLIEASSITVPGTFESTGAVRATASFNAFELTQQGTAMSHTGVVAALHSIAGMPTPVVMLAIASIALVASAVLHNALFAIISFALVYYARMTVTSARSLVENPMYGGEYMIPQKGLAWFSFAILFLIALTILVGMQVAITNFKVRQSRRASGENIPGVMDVLYSVHQGALARAAQRFETSRNDNSN